MYDLNNGNDYAENALQVNDNMKAYLLETGKWTKFISILGFIYIGLVIFSFIAAVIFGMSQVIGVAGAESVGLIIIFFIALIFMAVSIIPLWYLFQFSKKISSAVKNNDHLQLEESLDYLKRHYKFLGILIIVILVFYLFYFISIFLFLGSGMMGGIY